MNERRIFILKVDKLKVIKLYLDIAEFSYILLYVDEKLFLFFIYYC